MKRVNIYDMNGRWVGTGTVYQCNKIECGAMLYPESEYDDIEDDIQKGLTCGTTTHGYHWYLREVEDVNKREE